MATLLVGEKGGSNIGENIESRHTSNRNSADACHQQHAGMWVRVDDE